MSKSSEAINRKLQARSDKKLFIILIAILLLVGLIFSLVLPVIRVFYPSFITEIETRMYFGFGTTYLVLVFTLVVFAIRITALERLVAELQMKGAEKHPG